MKRDLRLLFAEVGNKVKREPHQLATEFNGVSVALTKHHFYLSKPSLRKFWAVLSGKRKLSQAALHRLALLAGFQDWKDLDDAIHGDVDASVNYNEEECNKREC